MGAPDRGDRMQDTFGSDEESIGPDMTVIINEGGMIDALASKLDVLDLLRRAPRLFQICSEQRALKDIRSVCRTARTLATSHISSLAIDCEEPLTASCLQGVLPLLHACSLQQFRVVMHLEHHGEPLVKADQPGRARE